MKNNNCMQEENKFMHKCENCWGVFASSKALKKHMDNTKYCLKYKNIMFSCTQCGWRSKGIKNVDAHVCCFSEKREKSLEDQITELKNEKEKLEISLKQIKKLYSLEKFKNSIWKKIIESNTNIKLPDILSETENSINVYEQNNGELSVVLHNWEQKGVPEGVTVKKEKGGKSYRSIKRAKIKKVETKNKPVRKEVKTLPLEDSREKFKDLFDSLVTSNYYSKTVSSIQKMRYEIFGKMTFIQYVELVKAHILNFEEIFKKKNYPNKKIKDIISKGLSSLEQRFLRYGDYTRSYLEINEMNKFKKSLMLSIDCKKLKPYSNNSFCQKFYNYGVVIFPIQELIAKYICNNIIYVPLEKSTKDDPYSFYTLVKITEKKRFWQMDCRLEYFTNNFIAQILPYLITKFRQIYNDVFHDNCYRENYKMQSQILECDCEQLLQNIIFLTDTKKVCNFLREKIKEINTYQPSQIDKFDLRGDDILQRKRFHKKTNVDMTENIKLLFDNITAEIAVDLYRASIT